LSNLILSRRDVDFLLFEWLGAEALCRREQFASHDRFGFDATLDVYETLARELFAPHNKKNDAIEPVFDGNRVIVNAEVGEAIAAMADAGLLATGFPQQWGGAALPGVIERAGMAFLLAANTATASYAVLTMANASLLLKFASDELRHRFIPAMASGKCFGTMCLSEPQAGSSLADIRTQAVPDDNGRYRLFGNKMWISGGDHDISENIAHLVLAKIPDESGRLPPGVKGISLFLVPRRLTDADGVAGEFNDVSLAGINHKMGYRGTVNCLLNFGEGRKRPGGAPGAIGEIIGEPGQGLAYMFHMMNEARISVGLGAAALAYTGYLHALDYARTRKQGRPRGERNPQSEPVPIVQHADVRRMLLAQKAYASGSLALCLYATRLGDDMLSLGEEAGARDASLLLDLLTPVVKSWPSQWGVLANDLAIQVHGGYGYTREYNVEQFYRDNRLNPIHEGTFGIQALDLLGRKVRLKNGAGMQLLAGRMAATCKAASGASSLEPFARLLERAWQRIESVTDELHAIADVELRLANASPYLEAFGHVVVAWLWLDQAIVAAAALPGAAPADVDFYRGKIAACTYFFGWEVPRVEGWLSVLSPVERTVLDTPEQWL
jgi:alkylation response protein AidB-like acyl-CoA dehydrogenase